MIPITEDNARSLSSMFRRDACEGTAMVTQKDMRLSLSMKVCRRVRTADLRIEYAQDRKRNVIEVHDIRAMAVTPQGLLIQSPAMDITIEIDDGCGSAHDAGCGPDGFRPCCGGI